MAGITSPMMLSDEVLAGHAVARLLAQVPFGVEPKDIEVWIYIEGEGVAGLEVRVVDGHYPVVFKRSNSDNPAGKILLAYGQKEYLNMVAC